MTVYEDFGRAEAPRRGITADVAIWAWDGEGGWSEPARRGTFATGSSWWAPQLHYGGPGYEQYGTTAGMGTGFTKLTGWPPGHPAAWRDAIRYGLDQARLGGWGPWYGAKAKGITGFYGIDRSMPWGGTPDAEWDFKKGIPPMTDVTALLQQLIALGKTQTGKPYSGPIVDQPESYRWGNPGFDCSSFVSWLYSQVTGGQIKLTAFTDAAYGQCAWEQTPQPGDVVFYHYVDSSQPGVTYPHMGIWLSSTETLDCRYPEGVGVHPHVTPISDSNGRYRKTMRPLGLESVVVTPDPAPAPVPDQSATIAALTAQVAALTAEKATLISQLGYARGDVGDALQAAVNTLRGIGV